MTRKLWMTAMMVGAGLVTGTTPVSAQDWWNPGWWTNYGPASSYGYRAGYAPAYGRSGCRERACPPSYGAGYGQHPGYGTGYRSPGGCGCRNCNCRDGAYDRRGPLQGPPLPSYRSDSPADTFAPYPAPDYDPSNYRGPTSSRPRYNPFYE